MAIDDCRLPMKQIQAKQWMMEKDSISKLKSVCLFLINLNLIYRIKKKKEKKNHNLGHSKWYEFRLIMNMHNMTHVDRHIVKRNHIHQIAWKKKNNNDDGDDDYYRMYESQKTNPAKYKIFFSFPNSSYAYNAINRMSIKLDF